MLTLGLRRWFSLTPLIFFLFLLLITGSALAAQITAAPTQGAVGTSVTVTGTGWPPGDLIDLSWEFNYQVTVAGVHSNNGGGFAATITVPQDTPQGLTYIDAGDQAAFLSAQALFCAGPNPPRFEIRCSDTFSEGPLVYFRLYFSDPTKTAAGFGFRGANGSGWGEESHPFSSPSYGRVFPGVVEYPFNHLCGTASEYQSDVEAWVYDSAGRQTDPVTVHLACKPFEFLVLPVAFESISYINWYGNTEFAHQNHGLYVELQGLHSGIDFIAPLGTPIRSTVNRTGTVLAINNKGSAGCSCNFGAGPGNLMVDYGDFLVLYGHIQDANNLAVGSPVNLYDTVAHVGSDGNLIHLHLEVIRKNPAGSSRPGDIRTNPVPFFTLGLGRLKQKASGSGATFHPIPGSTKWQTPESQPDIHPGGPLLVP